MENSTQNNNNYNSQYASDSEIINNIESRIDYLKNNANFIVDQHKVCISIANK